MCSKNLQQRGNVMKIALGSYSPCPEAGNESIKGLALPFFLFVNNHMNECTSETIPTIKYLFSICASNFTPIKSFFSTHSCFSIRFFSYILCQEGDADEWLAQSITNKPSSDCPLEYCLLREQWDIMIEIIWVQWQSELFSKEKVKMIPL